MSEQKFEINPEAIRDLDESEIDQTSGGTLLPQLVINPIDLRRILVALPGGVPRIAVLPNLGQFGWK